jgi:hypothetical protein
MRIVFVGICFHPRSLDSFVSIVTCLLHERQLNRYFIPGRGRDWFLPPCFEILWGHLPSCPIGIFQGRKAAEALNWTLSFASSAKDKTGWIYSTTPWHVCMASCLTQIIDATSALYSTLMTKQTGRWENPQWRHRAVNQKRLGTTGTTGKGNWSSWRSCSSFVLCKLVEVAASLRLENGFKQNKQTWQT